MAYTVRSFAKAEDGEVVPRWGDPERGDRHRVRRLVPAHGVLVGVGQDDDVTGRGPVALTLRQSDPALARATTWKIVTVGASSRKIDAVRGASIEV